MSDTKTRFQFSLLTLSLITIAYALGLATPKLVEYLKSDSSDGNAGTVKFSLVVTCTSSLEAGTMITNQDVAVENWPTTMVPDGGFTNIHQVVGKTLKSSTHIGQAVTKAELQATKTSDD